MTRIFVTDTGILLDGQHVKGDNLRQTPWYASVSRLGVPVSASLNDGVSVEVPEESVINLHFEEIPDTVTLEIVPNSDQKDLDFDQGVFDYDSFISKMSHSWVIARETLYFVAWFPDDLGTRLTNEEVYVDLSEDTPSAYIPILAMVTIKAHTTNFRMKNGVFCMWIDQIDPTMTAMEALQSVTKRLELICEAYNQLEGDAQTEYQNLIKKKVKPVAEAIANATSGSNDGTPRTFKSTEPTDTQVEKKHLDDSSILSLYTRFYVNNGIMEIDAEYLNVKVSEIPPNITIRVKTDRMTLFKSFPFYRITNITINQRRIRLQLFETQYAAYAEVIEALLEHLGIEATLTSESNWGKTFDVELTLHEETIVKDVITAILSGMEELAGITVWREAVKQVLISRFNFLL